jgi:hypothetical protein
VLSVLVDRVDISGGDDVDIQVGHRRPRRELVPVPMSKASKVPMP